jgi:hypothetical protein
MVMNRRSFFASLAVLVAILTTLPSFATCPVSCPTADDMAIQAMLDNTAAAGGGVVQLEPRVYSTCAALIVGSNTHLRGTGRGATIIQGSANISPSRIINGAHAAASIVSIGETNVTISDLTVDHRTCQRNSNGISFLVNNTSDVVMTDSVIRDVAVLGSGNPSLHNYMIWNLRGRGIKILHNFVDGGVTSFGPQEGIESLGGYDVLIQGNTVRNIGSACLNMGSVDLEDSETNGITAIANNLANCGTGINHGTANHGGVGPQSSAHIRLVDNVIVSPRETGISIGVANGTTMHDLTIARNTIRDMSGNGVIGIRMYASGASTLPVTAISANTVSGNHIANIRGLNAHGIRLTDYPNVRMVDNTFAGTDNAALYAMNADGIEFVGNRIDDGGAAPIQLHANQSAGFARFIVDGNLIEWGGASAAVLVLGGKRGTIRNNTMQRAVTSTRGPVSLGSTTCGVTVAGNVAWYFPSWSGVLASPACP